MKWFFVSIASCAPSFFFQKSPFHKREFIGASKYVSLKFGVHFSRCYGEFLELYQQSFDLGLIEVEFMENYRKIYSFL